MIEGLYLRYCFVWKFPVYVKKWLVKQRKIMIFS